MPTTAPPRKGKVLAHLVDFNKVIPLEDRPEVTALLVGLYNNFTEVIPTDEPFQSYVTKIRALRSTLQKYSLFIRLKLQAILLTAMQDVLKNSDRELALYVTIFCVIELSSLRNVDRSDLESKHILQSFTQLRSQVIEPLGTIVTGLRTNLPSILSWSLCMLIFTEQACIDWTEWLDCSTTVSGFIHSTAFKDVLAHESLPQMMRIALKLQHRRKPFPVPPTPFTLIELLFSCAVSNNINIVNRCKALEVDNSATCALEETEPRMDETLKRKDPYQSVLDLPEGISVSDMLDLSRPEWQRRLNSHKTHRVMNALRAINHAMIERIDDVASFKDHLADTLRSTTRTLAGFSARAVESNDDEVKKVYESAVILLLQLWYRSMEKRLLLSVLAQSTIWLAGFNGLNYQLMSDPGLLNVSMWMSRFLIRYASLFRSSILPSPHWFLQIMTDLVVTAIERSRAVNVTQERQEMLCNCVLSVSRVLSALHIHSPEVKPELSRCLRLPLESIVAALASSANAAVPQRLRDIVNSHFLRPILDGVIDPWCLNQARLGIRPPAARILLNQLIGRQAEQRDKVTATGQPRLYHSTAAVGGIQVAEKLAVKRRRLFN